jgi:hypothetical protein
MNSPRFRPAGLLMTWEKRRVMLDGATPQTRLRREAFLVSDAQAELMPQIRRRAAEYGFSLALASDT